MIKTNDVRIGNLFIEKTSGILLVVSGINAETNEIQFACHDKKMISAIPDKWEAEAIPLNFKWCELLGLTQTRAGDGYQGGQGYEYKKDRFIISSAEGSFYLNGGNVRMKYVHELQNVYYFNTDKKELKIK